MTMVVSGSPMGISHPPGPGVKQATTAISTFAFLTTGRPLTIPTRVLVTRIAERMLEIRPGAGF